MYERAGKSACGERTSTPALLTPGAQISSLGGGTSEPGNPWATLEKKRAVLTTAAHFYWSNRLDMKWP